MGVQMIVAPSEISAVVDEKQSLIKNGRFRAGRVQVPFGQGDCNCIILWSVLTIRGVGMVASCETVKEHVQLQAPKVVHIANCLIYISILYLVVYLVQWPMKRGSLISV